MKCALVLSALLAATVSAQAFDYPNKLSMDGIDNVTIGTDVDRVELLLHDKLSYNPFKNHGCSILTTPMLEPTGLSFMIETKKLTRVNVDYFAKSPLPLTIKTDAGIGLGASEGDVLKAYPNAKVKPNPADPTWHSIIVEAPDRTKGIVFETDGKTVKSMRAGANPAINYANGCN
jgi:hypothetical protein